MDGVALLIIALIGTLHFSSGSENAFARDGGSKTTLGRKGCITEIDVVKAVIELRLSDDGGAIVIDDAPDLKEFSPSSITMSLQDINRSSVIWRAGWRGKTPQSNLVDKFFADRKGLQSCIHGSHSPPSLSYNIMLSANSHPITTRQVRMTLPVVSDGGRDALLGYNRIDGSGSNASELLLLHKSKGKWSVSGYRVLGIS